jgi:formylglycine-generating enzyme required for sulfatase activity
MRLRRIYRKEEPEERRAFRGGYWGYDTPSLRASYRYDHGPSYRSTSSGARLSRPIGGKDEA